MLYGKDGSLSYFIKRFDRYGKGSKYATEDFAQLTEYKRHKISFYDGKIDSCT
jgi:serine/threonine-protein kinase HipA